ncbi:MAG TPA: hypothetical protein VKY19_17395 [Ktedonosporobacter sp.]|jgi:hypothetical protein|nr:hypothetical protein [Ktedonosporobacter sp.]HZO71188.1 hypothetical protein [Ktedonobacteraceae bacterium]
MEKTQNHFEDESLNTVSAEEKQLLTAEDLLHLQIEDDPFMLSDLNLCTVCSWTSSEL